MPIELARGIRTCCDRKSCPGGGTASACPVDAFPLLRLNDSLGCRIGCLWWSCPAADKDVPDVKLASPVQHGDTVQIAADCDSWLMNSSTFPCGGRNCLSIVTSTLAGSPLRFGHVPRGSSIMKSAALCDFSYGCTLPMPSFDMCFKC